MEKFTKTEIASGNQDALERFDPLIIILALILYIAERCVIFFFLLQYSNPAHGLDSRVMGFLFGQAPYSVLNLLLGFDLNQGLFGIIQPMNLLAVMIQAAQYLANYWIVRLPFLLIIGLIKRNSGR